MPAPSKPQTFDAYLGSTISNLAKNYGGREKIAEVLGVSKKTIDRRTLGDGAYTVKDLHLVADALNSSAAEILSLALRAYSDGSDEDGVAKLLATEGPSAPMSELPLSLAAHRKSKKKPLTEEEAIAHDHAAYRDPELDEPDDD